MDNTLTGPTYFSFCSRKRCVCGSFLPFMMSWDSLEWFWGLCFLFPLALDLTCCLDCYVFCLVFLDHSCFGHVHNFDSISRALGSNFSL